MPIGSGGFFASTRSAENLDWQTAQIRCKRLSGNSPYRFSYCDRIPRLLTVRELTEAHVKETGGNHIAPKETEARSALSSAPWNSSAVICGTKSLIFLTRAETDLMAVPQYFLLPGASRRSITSRSTSNNTLP